MRYQKLNKKGVVLITAYLVILVLLILGGAFLGRSVWESKMVNREKDYIKAFYLAEAGINKAKYELSKNYDSWSDWAGSAVNFADGQYNIAITADGTKRKISVSAAIPTISSPRVTRVFESFVSRDSVSDSNFYGNALYVSDDVNFEGNAYSVNGDVVYGKYHAEHHSGHEDNDGEHEDGYDSEHGDSYDGEHEDSHSGKHKDESHDDAENVTGTITHDPSASPLPALDFQALYNIALSQGNVYNEARLKNVQKNKDSFPASFWYSSGVPNVVYVTTDLSLSGNVGTVGGFLVVAGNVLTHSDDPEEAETTINGNGQVEGCIYTTGEFKINGGGGNLNVNGGVWSGAETEIKGTASVSYNATYQDAIKGLTTTPVVSFRSWREIR